ncbi:DinB family protein [Flavobacteriaceae bacterium TP-CH-4]|uniref:DinB family protein n=1 Tax=Pelagihabitans pacificus TaxID=2696054 RepID=A0A967AW43_9FLAO|nr:DinB family protein [Pelagihabitans pacificus]NHF60193.1 DinB family protein [Pelagihabitans pacificus]
MMTSELKFPEGNPFYRNYIDVVGEVELLDHLQRQLENFPKFIHSIPDEKLGYAYGKEKWTIAEALMHIIDSERVFQFRAFWFARGEQTPLPGFDQDVFAKGSDPSRRSKESLIEEYRIVRRSTISIFANLDRKTLERTGIASNLEWSVAALGFVICGHQRHHRNVIRERYL